MGRAQAAQPVLVNGAVGAVVAPRGRLLLVLEVTFAHGKIASISATRDPDRLRQMDLAML
jgi:RNA polymerase sigma-70 factor (ECF subfamily)